jgi:ribonuclease HI
LIRTPELENAQDQIHDSPPLTYNSDEEPLVVWADGSGSGYTCYVVEDGRQDVRRLSEGPESLAEFYAILHVLRDIPDQNLTIVSDSQSVVAILNRQVMGNSKAIQPLAARIFHRCRNRKVNFLWVPRSENTAGLVLERLIQNRFHINPHVEALVHRN